MTTNALQFMIKRHLNISTLEINQRRQKDNKVYTGFTCEQMTIIIRECSKPLTIRLIYMNYLDNIQTISIFNSSNKLKHIKIANHSTVTSNTVIEILKSCQNVVHLELQNCLECNYDIIREYVINSDREIDIIIKI